MNELKSTPPGAPVRREQVRPTSRGPVELSADQLAHVAGGGFFLSERMPRTPPQTLGFFLSE
ncbi:MAG: hypothetical protein U5L05_08905 [Rubrivivax sp.]|nr:hypothetical protein [Rubrivivax sp.]